MEELVRESEEDTLNGLLEAGADNPLERLERKIRRRTRVMGKFPDGHSALRLVAARLRYLSGKNEDWNGKQQEPFDELN